MPELPDLQVFSHNLNKQLSGKKVKEVIVGNSKKISVPKKTIVDAIEKQKIKSVFRKGKELYFEFENAQIISLHLMLNGEIHLFKSDPPVKYLIIQLTFTDGTGMALTDFRGLAKASLNPKDDGVVDATDIDFNLLKGIISNKRASIKNILLDQKLIGGIGNAYADEILWEAGLSPFSSAMMIPDKKIKDLVKSIKYVLKHAEQQILKSNPDIISGEIRDFLRIHTSKKTHSPSGVPIEIKKTGARKTYYTAEQELFT